VPASLFLLVALQSPPATPAGARIAQCQALTSTAEVPTTVRGRLYAANGGGSGFRIWLVGTTRVVWLTPRIDPAVPDAIRHAFVPFDEELYGDFTLVPLRPDRPGVMREVCFVGGLHLVARNVKTGVTRAVDGPHPGGAAPEPPPETVDVCELQAHPSSHNHALVEVTGVVTHDFEEFTLSSASCPSFGVWLEYGGTLASGTIYCCGTVANRSRPRTLVVEGVEVPLAADRLFQQFDAQIRGKGRNAFTATLRGRFFAGQVQHWPRGDAWGGYGHMGCCSLLAIQQVRSLDAAAAPTAGR
jgi:hypothetical protein